LARRNSALLTVKKRLQGQLKEALLIWRRETDHFVMDLRYKYHQRENLVNKKVAHHLSKIYSINRISNIRQIQ
jgi:hypothetical protein